MSGEVATLEAVREACIAMTSTGVRITADNIVGRVGGSKTTVLRHLHTLAPELTALAAKAADPEVAMLHGLADPFIKRLWVAAVEQATVESQRQIHMLLDIQRNLTDQVSDLRATEEALIDRAMAAEARLNARVDSQALQELAKAVDELRNAGKGHPGRSNTGKAPATSTAVMALLELLDEAMAPATKDASDEAMSALGYEPSEYQKARFHGLDGGFVGLALTEKGREKLAEWRKFRASA